MSEITERLKVALADRYRIERELGQGGMATVYLAEDLKHDRKVAIKVLKPELAAVLGAERFVQEIKTTAALSHPHILPLFDSGEAGGFLYYVMPYIQGETVREKLNRETQFGIEEAVRITTEVADALDYAHRHGVIHRDIKPENILLHDGRPMVMDFGIALALSAAAGGRMTETGLSLGTPHYMSPEQATADKDLTPRSDVYSLASVLYEMLTGNPPHMGSSAQQVVMKIVAEEAAPVTAVRKTVPANVAAAVAKALEKVPADRFETARAFADALGDAHFTTARISASATPAAVARPVLRLLPWGIAAAATAVAVLLATRAVEAPESSRPVSFVLEPPGDGVAVLRAVAISPDGRDIVFAGRARGRTLLYHRAMGQPGVRPIPGTEGAGTVIIRPDRSVVFWADNLLKTVRLDGGSPTDFARVGSPPVGMSWSDRDGLVLGMLAFSSPTGLSRVARGDTAVTVITRPAPDSTGSRMHHDPIILADGRHVVFTAFGSHQEGTLDGANRVGVASLSDGTWEAIELSSPPLALVGLADGLLVYLAQDGALTAVAWDEGRRRPVGEPIVIPGIPEDVQAAAIARDGTLAMIVAGTQTYEVVLVDEQGVATAVLPGETVTEFWPRYAPDGRRAVFGGDPRATSDVWIWNVPAGPLSLLRFGFHADVVTWTADNTVYAMPVGAATRRSLGAVQARRADGGDTVRAVYREPSGNVRGFDLSPDQRLLALTVSGGDTQSDSDIEVVPMRGGPPTAFATGPGGQRAPRFSPDGHWVAYTSNESGRLEVYVRALEGTGGVVQVSDQGGGPPVWSRDGRRLFYRAGEVIMVADLGLDRARGLPTVQGRRPLFSGNFFGSEGQRTATFDVSPDGSRFLMARAVGEHPPRLIVRMGWTAELKAALAARQE